MFSEDFFERNGFKRAGVVRLNAVFNFDAPRCIDFFIRRIEAREEFIDNPSFSSAGSSIARSRISWVSALDSIVPLCRHYSKGYLFDCSSAMLAGAPVPANQYCADLAPNHREFE